MLLSIVLLGMMALAHFWVGFLCRWAWNCFDGSDSSKFFSSIWYRIFFSLEIIFTLKSKFQYIFQRLVGVDNSSNHGNKDVWRPDDLDVRLITKLGLVLIPIGVLGFIIFYNFQPDKFGLYYVAFTSFVILIANAAWALIPSMLSSRFPIHLRSTGTSLAYNGGLAISFASPFIIIDFYFQFKSEYVIFLAMILGAVSMIVGGLKLMRIINEEKEEMFWKRYKMLEDKSVNSIVDGEELKNSLLSSHKFFASDPYWLQAVRTDDAYWLQGIIQDIDRAGSIKTVNDDNQEFYRKD